PFFPNLEPEGNSRVKVSRIKTNLLQMCRLVHQLLQRSFLCRFNDGKQTFMIYLGERIDDVPRLGTVDPLLIIFKNPHGFMDHLFALQLAVQMSEKILEANMVMNACAIKGEGNGTA